MTRSALDVVQAATGLLLAVQLDRRDDARAALAELRTAAGADRLAAMVEGLPAEPPPSLVEAHLDEHPEELRDLRAEGLTLAAIGARFGVSRQAVQAVLRDHEADR